MDEIVIFLHKCAFIYLTMTKWKHVFRNSCQKKSLIYKNTEVHKTEFVVFLVNYLHLNLDSLSNEPGRSCQVLSYGMWSVCELTSSALHRCSVGFMRRFGWDTQWHSPSKVLASDHCCGERCGSGCFFNDSLYLAAFTLPSILASLTEKHLDVVLHLWDQ